MRNEQVFFQTAFTEFISVHLHQAKLPLNLDESEKVSPWTRDGQRLLDTVSDDNPDSNKFEVENISKQLRKW